MVVQSGAVFQILAGRDTGWNPQRRDDGSIPLSDIVRRHRWHTALGIVTGIGAFAIATSLFLWMSPTILGLVLAIPLSWASGQLALGLALKRRGLLVTPEEETPPPIALRAGELAARNAAPASTRRTRSRRCTPTRSWPATTPRCCPRAVPAHAARSTPTITLARAKIVEAETLPEAQAGSRPRSASPCFTTAPSSISSPACARLERLSVGSIQGKRCAAPPRP